MTHAKSENTGNSKPKHRSREPSSKSIENKCIKVYKRVNINYKNGNENNKQYRIRKSLFYCALTP